MLPGTEMFALLSSRHEAERAYRISCPAASAQLCSHERRVGVTSCLLKVTSETYSEDCAIWIVSFPIITSPMSVTKGNIGQLEEVSPGHCLAGLLSWLYWRPFSGCSVPHRYSLLPRCFPLLLHFFGLSPTDPSHREGEVPSRLILSIYLKCLA